ncbi:MAG: efflux RND transporter periplasmic adaptor subunit [Gammaproteobacteria bacterium]|nr:efflux RND transporter periplasmic adaptor subunit [Gammaproteobacteria bacterium]MCH9744815.1 efflux RND transporter periplasmic adaptor subunit [Gammaproteobacteria bacterium]
MWKKRNFLFIFMGLVMFSSLAQASVGQQPAHKAIIVNVTKVGTETIPDTVPALGSLSAIRKVTISSEDDGRVSKINFSDGAEVSKDMPIIQLNNVEAQAAYQQAVTDYQLAQQKYNRSKQLLDQAISQQDLDALKADVATKQAAVQSAQAALSKKQVLAPFSGVLGAFQVQVGDFVHAGDPIVTLVNLNELHANYNIAENLLPKLKNNQLVKIKVSTYPDKTFYGTVNFISPTINQATRTVAIQATVPNKDNLLKPGMFVHAEQQIEVLKNAIVVPEQAILADVKGYYVYKVVGNKAAQVYIKVGTRLNGRAQVLSGLSVGDEIVTAGQQKLNDGSIISVSSSPTG